MTIRLALADEHPLLLEALESLFGSEGDFDVVASCRSGAEVLRAVRRHRPDVLLLDLRLSDLGGLGVLRELARQHLSIRTVLLTPAIEQDELLEALRLGVAGVVLKGMASRSIVQAVRKVHAGEPWLEKESISRMVDKLVRRETGIREVAGLLTPREMEVVRLAGRGFRNKELATRLGISEHTIKVHLSHIYAKLHVDGRLALLRYAEDKGLL